MWSSAAESHLLQHCVFRYALLHTLVVSWLIQDQTHKMLVLLKNLLRLNKVRHEQDLFQQFLILVLFLNRLHGPQLKIILVL